MQLCLFFPIAVAILKLFYANLQKNALDPKKNNSVENSTRISKTRRERAVPEILYIFSFIGRHFETSEYIRKIGYNNI